jgi:hypothetical protein
MKLTPFLVARSQLLTAIDLFFNDRDPVSVQVLAGNAREILEGLCRIAAIEPMTELLLCDHPSKPKKDIYAALNLYRNCFKRVGETYNERKADQEILNQFDDTKNEYLLYVCVEDYIRLRRSSPFPMQVFQAWFCALHVELLGSYYSRQKLLDRFPGVSNMTRWQQERCALGVIKQCSDDPELLGNPETELILIDH